MIAWFRRLVTRYQMWRMFRGSSLGTPEARRERRTGRREIRRHEQ